MKVEGIARLKVLNTSFDDLQLVQEHLDVIFSFIQGFLGLLDFGLHVARPPMDLVVHDQFPMSLANFLLDVLPQIAPGLGDLVVLLDAACVCTSRVDDVAATWSHEDAIDARRVAI